MGNNALVSLKPLIRELKRKTAEIFENNPSEAFISNAYLIKSTSSAVCENLNRIKRLPGEKKYPSLFLFVNDYVSLSGNIFSDESVKSLFAAVRNGYRDICGREINAFFDILKLVIIKRLFKCTKEGESENCFAECTESLRFINNTQIEDLYALISPCEDVFRRDCHYPYMTVESRNLYRHRLSVLAEKQRISEYDLLQSLTEKASRQSDVRKGHIGYYLLPERYCPEYIFSTCVITLCFCMLVWAVSGVLAVAVISLLPSFFLARTCSDRLFSMLHLPSYVPGMNCEKRVPKTLVAVVSLLEASDCENLCRRLEQYYITNREEGFVFGILGDLKECDSPVDGGDELIITGVTECINHLNDKYGERFFACIRRRVKNTDGIYCGRERKRGAVCDLVNLTCTRDLSEFNLCIGDVFDAKYIVCLDSDTRPGIGSLSRLIGVLEHPLSTPEYTSGKVVSGYGIAVPKMCVDPVSAAENLFSQLYSGAVGTEYYDNASYETYQDIFGAGNFAGKGAIRVESFRKTICSDFADGSILSHDIIEGEVLRTAFVSDAVFTDYAPSNPVSYMKRAHRWARGDVQNIPFLFGKIKLKSGIVRNPLSLASKAKITDNVLRTLSPAAMLLIFVFSLFFGWGCTLCGFVLIFFPVIFTAVSYMNFGNGTPLRYVSRRLCSATVAVLGCFFNLVWLPYEALTKTDAVLRGIFRLFSGKKLLEWKTASSVDSLPQGKLSYFVSMPQQYIGLAMLFSVASAPIGILWLSGVPLTLAAIKPYREKQEDYTNRFKSEAEKMWAFFIDTVNEKSNYLPLDNIRIEPMGVECAKTSPTNIGLYMLSCLGAYYMAFISEAELAERLSNTLNSVEKLEKYNGHLYNWYDTSTLKKVPPEFISTVDSGNFNVALYTLANGLDTCGSHLLHRLSLRIRYMLSKTDFGFLFDKKTKQFYVGYDKAKECFSSSHYDFYQSEARLCVYYAIAIGAIPRDSWSRLDRAVFSDRGVMYSRSWSGTAFEYLLPHIFLPVYPLSFDEAALGSCLRMQVSEKHCGLWGKSESQYYAFDKLLNYQYRAFGLRSCAVDPDYGSRAVISPYSSFLALPYIAEDVADNLKKAEKRGLTGIYGFYEAADCSSGEIKAVKSYMSHHTAMAFLSIVNYTNDNIIQKKFFDNGMSAFAELLKNAPPFSAKEYVPIAVNGKNPGRRVTSSDVVYAGKSSTGETRCIFGKDTGVFVSDSGQGYISFKNFDVTRRPSFGRPCGIYAFRRGERGITSFGAYPFSDGSSRALISDGAELNLTYESRDTDGRISYVCDSAVSGVHTEIALRNKAAGVREEEIILYFEPVLCNCISEESHPMYSALFVEFMLEGTSLLCRRRKRYPDEASLWLAVDTEGSDGFCVSRLDLLDCKGNNPFENIFNAPFNGDVRGAVSPCIALKYKKSIAGGRAEFVHIPMAVGENKADALNSLEYMKKCSYRECRKTAERYTEALLRENSVDRACLNILYQMSAAMLNECGVKGFDAVVDAARFYPYGIGDDIPRFFVCLDSLAVADAVLYIKTFAFLRSFGRLFELIIYCFEGSAYNPSVSRKIKSFISENYPSLLNTAGGIFVICDADYGVYSSLLASSCLFADLKNGICASDCKPYIMRRCESVVPLSPEYTLKCGIGGYTQRGFASENDSPVPWSNVICNGNFSTVVTDNSLGYTAFGNSQLDKLTPWINDYFYTCGGERLIMNVGGNTYDILRGAACEHCPGMSVYRSRAGNTIITVTVTVSLDKPVKIINVETETSVTTDYSLMFFPKIILGNRLKNGVKSRTGANFIEYENRLRTNKRAVLWAVNGRTCGKGVVSVFSGVGKNSIIFCLGGSESEGDTRALVMSMNSAENCFREIERVSEYYKTYNPFTVSVPDKNMSEFVSRFLYYQADKCRLRARTSMYQCGGAYGFRDQLQDAENLSLFNPEILKNIIIKCCNAQFEQGDVLHWWHECPDGKKKGIRTLFGDDLLWLPEAVCHYIFMTEDYAFLARKEPYCVGNLLSEGELEHYDEYTVSPHGDTVYRHSVAALKNARRIGPHGLVRFGGGDWNDGMNGVGGDGRGESTWTTLFYICVLRRFCLLAEKIRDTDVADFCKKTVEELTFAVETHAWAGDRYIRGFYGDGEAIGENGCEIDLIVQSFAALCGVMSESRVITALNTAYSNLTDKKNGIVKLFTPPFEGGRHNPGYIGGYIPGVRENGGQYTHGALWFCRALFNVGMNDTAYDILSALCPVNHCKDRAESLVYKKEPYVISADVYTNPSRYGMGGWSWYTGSAGWYLRCMYENVFGITRRGDKVYFHPCIFDGEDEMFCKIRIENTEFELKVIYGDYTGLTLDGKPCEYALLDGGRHSVVYIFGKLLSQE